VGQHGTARSIIWAVPGLPLRGEHDGPQGGPAGPELQDCRAYGARVVLCDSSETECACVVRDLSETVSVCGLIVVTLCVHLVTVIVNHFIMELMHQ
jgi:hypothetical protein